MQTDIQETNLAPFGAEGFLFGKNLHPRPFSGSASPSGEDSRGGRVFLFGKENNMIETKTKHKCVCGINPGCDKGHAAAPKLLEALKMAMNQLNALSEWAHDAKLPRPELTEAWGKMESAISEAEGESK